MVASVFHPLNIFLLGLAGGFAIPLLVRISTAWLSAGFFIALVGIWVVSGVSLLRILAGEPPIDILTAGSQPPIAISLRFGLAEGFVAASVNVVAILGALHLWDRLRGNYAALLLYLGLTMGINGMVMTRDLFNLFVFLEIVSIATYGLLALERTPAALGAAFKFIMATVIASSFFLLGTGLLYLAVGTLGIDELIAARSGITGPIGEAAILLVLASLIIELKPFPANGWGLDVYETAPSGIAAMVSVGASAGVFFSLVKLLPLFEHQFTILAAAGGLTFLLSNLVGLKQSNIQRLLGYSSVGQMGLLLLALALLHQTGRTASIPLVVGGLFLNHLLAKAGLFWIAAVTRQRNVDNAVGLAGHPLLTALLTLFLVAIAGLPPFPGFWAKWELVMQLTSAARSPWVVLILAGSLLEAAYMFRWFVRALSPQEGRQVAMPSVSALFPVMAVALLLCIAGYVAARASGAGAPWIFAPLLVGAALFLLDWMPGRAKAVLMLAAVLSIGGFLAQAAQGIAWLFAVLLLAGSLTIAAADLYRDDVRPGYYPLLAVLLLSIQALLRSSTSLEFFFAWEIVTLSTGFLIMKGRRAGPHVLSFVLFSLLSAFLLLAGFAGIAASSGTTDLRAFMTRGPEENVAFLLLAVGFLIKAGAIGVHVWLPGAYSEADDDFTAMLSGVVSKLAVFGLLMGTYLAIRSEVGLELAHAMAWLGMLTTIAGAVMALRQTDFKCLLALSSMSQLGYIVTAIALMSHLGWVTALYLVANHMMVKGILFLAVAGIILRTGTRSFAETGGLARAMPITFGTVLVAIISMSGLPPLMGFGGKWLLLSAMMDKGWYFLAIAGLLATFLGFLYMIRLVGGLFLVRPEGGRVTAGEAPASLLAPQIVLIVGIVILSLYPKLLMDPVSAAIDPQFASTLVWNGMSLEMIYGYWNPAPTMITAVAIALILGLIARLLRPAPRPDAVDFRRLVMLDRLVPGLSVPPVAVVFWRSLANGSVGAADLVRRLYTGNGQTYALYVLSYILVVYVAGAGLVGLWIGD
ncbi:proton-conducting transporter membrane subunit [Microvirga zambiensis]|uniref:proton-conducting transporter transmembrane domain-containing protein n=1 Tax=Microvirga zambiensis TaxID=1402137 RepID=UPI00191DCE30|nr:proton-conducting transporter membrane subunit [Microvirga zambiensis]